MTDNGLERVSVLYRKDQVKWMEDQPEVRVNKSAFLRRILDEFIKKFEKEGE